MSYKPSSSRGLVLSSKDLVLQSQPGDRSRSNAPQSSDNYETRYTLPPPHRATSGHKAIDQYSPETNDKQLAPRGLRDLVEAPSSVDPSAAPQPVSAGYRIKRVRKSKAPNKATAQSVAPHPSHEAIGTQSPPSPDSAVATRPSFDVATNPSPAVPADPVSAAPSNSGFGVASNPGFAIPTNLLAFMPTMGGSLNLSTQNAAKEAERDELRKAKQATRDMETALVRQTHILNITSKEQEHRDREAAAREKLKDARHVTYMTLGAALGNLMGDLADINTREMEEDVKRAADDEETKQREIREAELEERKRRAQEALDRKREEREEAKRAQEWEKHLRKNREHEKDQDERIAKEKREFYQRHSQRELERHIRYDQVAPKVIEQGIDFDGEGGERPYLSVRTLDQSQGRLEAPHRAGLLTDGRERSHGDPSRYARKGSESGSRRHRSRSRERKEPSRGSHGYRKTIR